MMKITGVFTDKEHIISYDNADTESERMCITFKPRSKKNLIYILERIITQLQKEE